MANSTWLCLVPFSQSNQHDVSSHISMAMGECLTMLPQTSIEVDNDDEHDNAEDYNEITHT